jgi:AcrR family transcriptional regulator
MSGSIDRRIARTQAAMRGALMRLLRRRPYVEITVQEILHEANIGRSTFYAHCSGKDQLLRLSFKLLGSELATMVAPLDTDPAKPLSSAFPSSSI